MNIDAANIVANTSLHRKHDVRMRIRRCGDAIVKDWIIFTNELRERCYLNGATNIAVYTDHQNLKDFMSQTRSNGRHKFLPYDFHIFYRKGALNPADGPSRRPDY